MHNRLIEMIKTKHVFFVFVTLVFFSFTNKIPDKDKAQELNQASSNFDAASFGFSPTASGIENAAAMQKALEQGGTIVVSEPGTYKIASTLYIGSDTEVLFGKGVSLKKVDEQGNFAQLFINRGALTKIHDENIAIEGLHIIVNGVDNCSDLVLGLRGVLGFSYVKDLRIKGLRCCDLTGCQYCL